MATTTTEATTPAALADVENTVLDRAHLSRMTFGDRALEREVLDLFLRHGETLLADLAVAGPESAASLAHSLKGSARGIGAWRVAAAAEHLEQAATAGAPALGEAVIALSGAMQDAKAAIDAALRAP